MLVEIGNCGASAFFVQFKYIFLPSRVQSALIKNTKMIFYIEENKSCFFYIKDAVEFKNSELVTDGFHKLHKRCKNAAKNLT